MNQTTQNIFCLFMGIMIGSAIMIDLHLVEIERLLRALK